MNLSQYYKNHYSEPFFPESIPKQTQNLEFCQSQRRRFALLEAASYLGDRSDAEGGKGVVPHIGKNQVLGLFGYKVFFRPTLLRDAFRGSIFNKVEVGTASFARTLLTLSACGYESRRLVQNLQHPLNASLPSMVLKKILDFEKKCFKILEFLLSG